MNQKQIDKHRLIEPLKFNKITAYSSFTQILGSNPQDYTPEQRKERWAKHMNLLNDVAPEMADYWRFGSEECCEGCIHRDMHGNHWCKFSELPCLYNPVIKMCGMACCGLGHETNKQLDLFED